MSHKHINISTLQLDLEGEFIAKLKLLTTYFESRMNGAIAHQMQQAAGEGQRYKLNYGVSLVDMKSLVKDIEADERIVLSKVDYDALWKTDIREAMLLALLLIPEEMVTVERVDTWVESIHTYEMADMLPFIMSWKVDDSAGMVESAIESYEKAATLQRIAYTNTIGRLLAHGRVTPAEESVRRYVSNLASDAQEEMGSITYLHNMMDR